MAVRRPLYYTGGDLQEMNDTQLGQIRNRAEYLYGANPSVDLTVVASAGSVSTGIQDYYMRSGVALSNSSRYPSESLTSEPLLTAGTSYDKINEVVESLSAPTDTNNKRYPVYYDGTDIVAMTQTDFYDTFITQAINQLVESGDQPGTYRIHTSTSLPNHTNVSATPVFVDLIANLGQFTSANIVTGQRQTHNTTNANYYLMRTNQSIMTAPTYTSPYYLTSTNDIQEFTTANFDTVLQEDIRYWATQTGSKLSYNINGSGVNKGSSMTDRGYFNSTGNYKTRYVDANDYRAQEMPNGSLSTRATWTLRLARV